MAENVDSCGRKNKNTSAWQEQMQNVSKCLLEKIASLLSVNDFDEIEKQLLELRINGGNNQRDLGLQYADKGYSGGLSVIFLTVTKPVANIEKKHSSSKLVDSFVQFLNDAFVQNMFSMNELFVALGNIVTFILASKSSGTSLDQTLEGYQDILVFLSIMLEAWFLSLKEEYSTPKESLFDLKDGLTTFMKNILKISRFPEQSDCRNVCVLDVKGMKTYTTISESCLKSINFLLCWFCMKENGNETLNAPKSVVKHVLRQCSAEIMTLLFANYGKHEWTSIKSRKEADRSVKLLMQISSSENLEALLTDDENNDILPHSVLGCILRHVHPRFVNDGWKRDPTLKHVVLQGTMNVKYPNLRQHIPILVPILLEMTEDYKIENQVLGIGCLQYLIDNVNASDLNLNNHGVIVYQVLFKLLYGPKQMLLQILLSCIKKILFVLEPFPARVETERVSKWDETIQKMISNLEYENDVYIRRMLLKSVNEYTVDMGINCVKHINAIFRVASASIEIQDGENEASRKSCLDVIESLVISCWPVMSEHTGTILKIIFKLIVDLNMKGSFTSEEATKTLTEKSLKIIELLGKCGCNDAVGKYLAAAQSADFDESFAEVKSFFNKAIKSLEL